jgi:glucose/arabinose dehydrogenase
MKKSIVLVALGGMTTSLFAACGGETNSGPEPSTSTSGPVTGPVAPQPGPSSSVAPVTNPSGGTSPGTSPVGPTAPTGTTGTNTSPTPTTGGSATTGPATTGTETTSGPVGTTDTMGETSEPTGPVGPPEGAYVPCSGEPMPNVVLTPYLMAPKVQSAIDMDMPPGQPNMVYVTERAGKLKRFDMSQANPEAVEILSVNTSTESECGFFGVAFHPNFDGETEKRMYISYMPRCTAIFGADPNNPGLSALEEYVIEGDTATKVKSLFEVNQPQGNHNGGNVAFGPDGYLYYSLGDGGNSDDTGAGHGPNGNGQDVNEPLGSILRFDVDNPAGTPPGNLTSADVGGASVDSRILHYGLRNPWRFSFDRVTGDLWIGDVGQGVREEIDFLPKGTGPTNFGWAVREGKGERPGNTYSLLAGTTAKDPIYDYATNPGGGFGFAGSVTGGYVYRGQKIPGMYGRYIFGDFVTATFYSVTANESGEACDELEGAITNSEIARETLVSFAEDPQGELYVIAMARDGGIFRLDPAP